MGGNRDWMYKRFHPGGLGILNEEFVGGLEKFIEFATSQPRLMDGEKIKCPCKKCDNMSFQSVNEARLHIKRHGFVKNYKIWVFHGELPQSARNFRALENIAESSARDVAGTDNNMDGIDEPPNPQAQNIYDMLKAMDAPLWPGCETHTQFSLFANLMSLKFDYNMSESCFDRMSALMKEIVPKDNLVTENFYNVKKMLHGLGLPVEKIDCCLRSCMIYWGGDSKLLQCKFCGHPRYKNMGRGKKKPQPFKKMYYFPLTPRLQRLYASNVTAKEMRWHASSHDGVMRHPCDSAAWKHLNQKFPEFAAESRNVRLGLSIDEFQPSGQQYSSWPVIITPYNLPPGLCMKEHYMFLTILVPGPKNPKDKIDVFLQPLISELCDLWENGVNTYDVSLRQNFQMRAALIWTISDFSAYSMLSGWSTTGKSACPHCMEDSDAFYLSCSVKVSWFDNHRKFLPLDHPFRKNKSAFIRNREVNKEFAGMRDGVDILKEIEDLGLLKVTELGSYEVNKIISTDSGFGWKKRSIFWDLPYWKFLLIRHNLDVMHIEKNVFDNIFNTVLNIPGRTKDTVKSRNELNTYCNRPELRRDVRTGRWPKACYTLDKDSKKILFDWIKELKFPDGYILNMSRCVDMQKLKMFGMKSHDCHVMMQRILPIAFREFLPPNVWKAITEISLFFRDLTSQSISIDDMCRLHESIPLILCKLERIFPPSFFDSMEHLLVHLADEARIAGPVQYRWMYPFERYLRKLKNNVRKKVRVEGSICNAYLVEEASLFCSYYFEDHVHTRHRNVPHNYVCQDEVRDEDPNCLFIFKAQGRAIGKAREGYLDDDDYNAAMIYVLVNCAEIEPYIKLFVDHMIAVNPNCSRKDVDDRMDKDFAKWFKQYVQDPTNNVSNAYIRDLSRGPLRSVRRFHGYNVNGYKFHTLTHEVGRSTINSGICVKGSCYGSDESDWYGRLIDIVELEYPGLPLKRVVLFKCEWFDISTSGTQVHADYKLVSVNHKRKLQKYEPFILANQATQVFYCTYPSTNHSNHDWWAVCKIKARTNVMTPQIIPPPFQEDEAEAFRHMSIDVDPDPVHTTGEHMIIIDEDSDTSEEFEDHSSQDVDSGSNEDSDSE